jgi:hypothetical protein
MRRIGFRRVFPVVLTLIHIVLIWFAQTHPSASPHIVSQYRPVAYQEGDGAPMEVVEPPSLKPVRKIALILELPAMFVATLIGAVLFPLNETAWLFTSIPFVPLVWYVIGRWLDGLLGYCARLRLPRILRTLLAVPAGLVLCVGLAGFTPLYHHRTADTYWMFSGLVLWSGLCLTMTTSSGR